MSANIAFSLSNVAGTAVQEVNANATLNAGGGGGQSSFAGVVIAEKGRPFTLLRVTSQNWQSVLGRPYHPSVGAYAEPLRHVGDAVNGGVGYVVRVVAEDARFSVLNIVAQKDVDQNITGYTPVVSDSPYGSAVAAGADTLAAIYLIDGDPAPRTLAMTAVADKPGFFNLTLKATDAMGSEYEQEKHCVSFDPLAVDDMGTTAFIESRLEQQSQRMRVALPDGVDIQALSAAFTGFAAENLDLGTNGNQKVISPAQYTKALSVLAQAQARYTAVLSLGCYDATVLSALGSICRNRRIDGFMDLKPAQTYASALQEMQALNISNHHLCFYHFPYRATDPYYGGKTVWGLSGLAFVAKARGVAKVNGTTGGWHYSPAGEERAVIDRRGLEPIANLDTPDYEAMYTARINRLGVTNGGLLIIDDAITAHPKEDYLRFQHVSSIMSYIARQFDQLAQSLKHQPDGITDESLSKGIRGLLDDLVAAEALVPPRNPDDGAEPYRFSVEQVEIDAWECKWAVCCTGTSRRILGTPSLIR